MTQQNPTPNVLISIGGMNNICLESLETLSKDLSVLANLSYFPLHSDANIREISVNSESSSLKYSVRDRHSDYCSKCLGSCLQFFIETPESLERYRS